MKAVLFDLDGTLIDSSEGITKSAQYALEYFGIHENDRKVLYPFRILSGNIMDSIKRKHWRLLQSTGSAIRKPVFSSVHCIRE